MEKMYITKGYSCSKCGNVYETDVLTPNGFPSTCRSCHASLPWDDCFWKCPNCGSFHAPGVTKCNCGFDRTIHGL